ncbi:hypothetical protein COY16_01065 [Candidatus Roizmanbacteria bacterium CG_4_10_14_0_2_um_filter_39_13]|uniref:Lactamase n=1 Tax=Candidatus Roizmanbacteria bacterium CG_4_10_14_0_2_um_filter_39_13 TaxID=1974825 RepID=A0A2M7U115_9BACT|nr:MAG: hypothetical protein COY16_01065 [Candidatus Roizmanbacteria bacterium CG_4_10_14_0_2_um_filter_39_13]
MLDKQDCITPYYLVIYTLLMDIKYFGHSSFYIRTKTAKIVTDPYDSVYTGLKFPKTEADIVTISHDHNDHNSLVDIKGEPLVLTWPGEFEKNQVRITGFQSFHDKKNGEERGENVIYKFEADDFTILHCGDLGHLIQDEIVDQIGSVDVVMIPVGGLYTIDPVEAGKVLNDLEPSIVIPMHYGREDLKKETFVGLQPLEAFLKEIGATDVEPIEKLTLKREELTGESTRVVVLQNI